MSLFWQCIYESETKHKHGITNLHLAGNRVIAARLSGRIDFLRLESYTQGRHIDWGFTAAYRRSIFILYFYCFILFLMFFFFIFQAHVRAGSTGSLSNFNLGGTSSSINPKEELRCILEQQHQGHQQPISCMDVVGGLLFTGSQDHTLKVFF